MFFSYPSLTAFNNHYTGPAAAWGSLVAPDVEWWIIQAFRESTLATLFEFLCRKTYAGSSSSDSDSVRAFYFLKKDSFRASRFVVEKLMWCAVRGHSEGLVNAGPVEQRGNRVDPAAVVIGDAVVTSWLRASSYS